MELRLWKSRLLECKCEGGTEPQRVNGEAEGLCEQLLLHELNYAQSKHDCPQSSSRHPLRRSFHPDVERQIANM